MTLNFRPILGTGYLVVEYSPPKVLHLCTFYAAVQGMSNTYEKRRKRRPIWSGGV